MLSCKTKSGGYGKFKLMIQKDIQAYNNSQVDNNKSICNILSIQINEALPNAENKIWHGAPVWFLDGNPVAGYNVQKNYVRLLFWSGQSFNEPSLHLEGSFKAAEARYKNVDDINKDDLKRWLEKSIDIQWDYKNIVKRRGELIRIK